jgi:hypothetical protein
MGHQEFKMNYSEPDSEEQRKKYDKPEIKLELDLEIRAGSPDPSIVDPLALPGLE